MSYYLLAIGGTGNKILEALVYACAADALYTLDEDNRRVPLPAVNALIVDVDAACGNTTRAKQAAEHYENVRLAFAASRAPHRGFHTALTVERWNMNLAKRAASVSGMTQNHRRDRLLADSLFSRTEAELEYSEGFRGHPDLGVLFFADLLGNLDTLAAEGQPDAIVHQALAVHALAHARLVEQVDADLLQHAGADTAEHIVGAALLEHDVVDAGLVQQLAEQQAGRAGADDDDLGAAGKGHGCLLGVGSTARA